MSITHSAMAETTNPSQATMKFAIVYIPGALMLGRSMNKIRAFLKHALTPHDIESMTWQYNPYEQKESALDARQQRAKAKSMQIAQLGLK